MINLLLVEDNPGDARLIREMVAGNRIEVEKLTWLTDLSSAISTIREETYDVILLDLGLPDSNGLETLNRLTTVTNSPIIVLTGNNDEELAVVAIRNGAHDYLIKGELNETGLERSIRYTIERKKAAEAIALARQKAEEADHLKSTLMMNLSHEVRTPMNSILGFSSLIIQETTDREIREMSTRIKQSGDRLMKTLDDIMELSQLQSGIGLKNHCECNLGVILTRIVEKFKGIAYERNLVLNLNLRNQANVILEKTLIEKAISELMDNAIKFTREGGILVDLDTIMIDDHTFAEIRISDTGIGIAREYQEVIFDSFRQLSEGFGRNYEGTGLGLTIAKKIIELSGGMILVESEANRGSVFIIRLPVTANSVSDSEGAKPARNTVETKTINRREEVLPVILLVEDNEDNALVTKLYLAGECTIDWARNGPEAIRLARQKQYDTILMDINLGPGMDGLETAKEIRKINGNRSIPIVALTGFTLQVDRERILSGGCTHYLGKPFTKQEIIKLFAGIFTRS